MPVVPTEFLQDVLPAGQLAYQQNHATPDEFGARMARTLELAGRRLERDALKRIDETNVNDLFANQFDPAFRGIYKNFLNLGGKEAAEQLPAVRQQMMDLTGQFSEALPNDYQRSLFNQMSNGRMNSDLSGLARHAAASLDQWKIDTAGAISDAAARRIGDNIYDFDKVAGPDGLINGIRRMSEAGSGVTAEDRPVSGLRAAGSIDKGLSDAILNEAQSNPKGAKLLYDQYQQFFSSDAVRDHVLGNLSPILSNALKTDAFNDTIAKFGAVGPPAGAAAASGGVPPLDPDAAHGSALNGATAHVMDLSNYPDLDPDQRSEVARAVRAELNQQSRTRDDSQKAANDNLQVGAISGSITPEQLLSWRDPKTGLSASPQTVNDVGEWLANPIRAANSNPDALAGLAKDIAWRRLTDAAPINDAFRSGDINQADWMHMRDLFETGQDPTKSRWFDYAKDAFNARYADPASPNGVSADAMKVFPSFLMDLNGTVRDQDLKGTQVRDLTNKMLNDVNNLLPPPRDAGSSSSDNSSPFGLWVAQRLGAAGKVVSDDTIKTAGEKLTNLYPDIDKNYPNIDLEF